MLLTRDEIRHGKSFDLLTEAILERDQPRTTDLFFRVKLTTPAYTGAAGFTQ